MRRRDGHCCLTQDERRRAERRRNVIVMVQRFMADYGYVEAVEKLAVPPPLPGAVLASTTVTERPASAIALAADSPPSPAPITATSTTMSWTKINGENKWRGRAGADGAQVVQSPISPFGAVLLVGDLTSTTGSRCARYGRPDW